MRRHHWGYGLVLTIAMLNPLGAENPGHLQEVLTLEKSMEEAIAKAEPSIVCILVSRCNDKYAEARQLNSEEDRNRG
jgi:hypothetical protein